ncbi:hypothetical protein BLA6992_00615 [Burkholderia lata]|nr:hypothetical protein BLA6992_00615 [Burkholderia lata]
MRIRLLDDNLPARLNELARVHGAGTLRRMPAGAARGPQGCTRATRFRRTLYCIFIQFSMTTLGASWAGGWRSGFTSPGTLFAQAGTRLGRDACLDALAVRLPWPRRLRPDSRWQSRWRGSGKAGPRSPANSTRSTRSTSRRYICSASLPATRAVAANSPDCARESLMLPCSANTARSQFSRHSWWETCKFCMTVSRTGRASHVRRRKRNAPHIGC